MPSFKDCKGNDWRIAVTVGDVANVKRETGVNLALVKKNTDPLTELADDAEKFVAALWVLCQEQAESRGITPEQFAHCFDGQTLQDAGYALVEGLTDFFHHSKVAEAIKKKLPRVVEQAAEKAIQRIASLMDSEQPTNSAASAE